ncbi:MAG: hypothetical protein QOD00_1289 [Blastocatellia bacterium]|nr:hypothetical protein [Blastocatellia bacterium]
MRQSLPCCPKRRFRRPFCAVLFLVLFSLFGLAHAAPAADSPVLISDAASTRAIALESATMKGEPFALDASVPYSADSRTRVEFFVMNLNMLSGEGVNALSADAEDSAHNRYPLIVEYAGQVPSFEGIYMIVVRLNDNMGDVGDVLVRLNLHGVASNRVRVGIGHVGGGPADDSGAVPTPAPATPPAPQPAATPNPYTDPALAAGGDGVRFLEEATFGPTQTDLAHLRAIGFRAYLNEQFNTPSSGYPAMALFPIDNNQGCPSDANNAAVRGACIRDNYSFYPIRKRFYQNALTGQDQLRQRVAFSLSQIMVISGRDLNVTDMPSWMTPYLQTLDRNAFGNFRQLLYEMTLNPAMGDYLNMAGNNKSMPNENYAREVLQLFSVGLDQLNQDGTPKLDAQGNRIPTYDQSAITNFARVFTGWRIPAVVGQNGVFDYVNPMTVGSENNHDTGQKVLLNGQVLPAGQNSTQDLNAAIDNIFNHPNVGPYIGKELIHHLVTSNPSPAYVGRVAAVFNNNGAGVRGDMKAVIAAILLDPEARGDIKTDPNYGHLREPVLYITNLLRAFNATSDFDISGSNSYGQTVNGTFVVYSNGTANYPATMDQDLFRSPTVFNYFPADYVMPGTTDVLGPEFGILSATTTLKRANFVNTLVFSGITPSAPDKPTGTQLDFSNWQSQGGNPAQLVDSLNALMMHGAMSSGMRSAIVQNVSNISASNPLLRAQTAVYLVATSAQYQVER